MSHHDGYRDGLKTPGRTPNLEMSLSTDSIRLSLKAAPWLSPAWLACTPI